MRRNAAEEPMGTDAEGSDAIEWVVLHLYGL